MTSNPFGKDILISLDLETYATSHNAVILSIGAAAINPDTGEELTFYTPVNIESQSERYTDPKTVAWWKKRGLTHKHLMEECTVAPDLRGALNRLNEWVIGLAVLVKDGGTLLPMGNGASFDVGILDSAYADCGMAPPWAFWNVRDLRTMKWIFEATDTPMDLKREGVHHNAVDDAVHQLRIAAKVFAALAPR